MLIMRCITPLFAPCLDENVLIFACNPKFKHPLSAHDVIQMTDFSNLHKYLAEIESLEKDLHLKQLQINRLLSITQAINSNVGVGDLYTMYRDFLQWEMDIKRMVLYIKEEETWLCSCHLGMTEKMLAEDVAGLLPKFDKMTDLGQEEADSPFLKKFDLIIPVKHKDHALAYLLIGGFQDDEDMYNKVQLITAITNVIVVAIENKRLFKRQLEQELLKKEMDLAAGIQKLLIPETMPKCKRYDFAAIYKPHMVVGGDYYDFIEAPNDKIVFCIGDFTGKGLGAAMLMANFQANFHTLIHRQAGLDETVRDLNQAVNRITKGERFITFFLAEYDLNLRRLRYINAGHNRPYLASENRLLELREGCFLLGSLPKLPRVDIGEVVLEPGEEAVILTFTDGLVDIQNSEGENLSEQLLQDFTQQHFKAKSDEFNQYLQQLIDDFKGEENYPDDFTVLTCKLYN